MDLIFFASNCSRAGSEAGVREEYDGAVVPSIEVPKPWRFDKTIGPQ
jgi:hypothetical protein